MTIPNPSDPPATTNQPQGTGYAYIDWQEAIAERVPALDTTIWRTVQDQMLLAATVIGDQGTHNAVRLIVNQSVNDLVALLTEIGGGSGRPAMRSARTLIEHAINLHTVAEGLPTAQRYLDHLDLANALLHENQVGAELLRGRTRRDYQQTLARLGKNARAAFDRAVTLYGNAFKRGWSNDSIANRAERHGLADLYEFYRLASLVAHGAAGGTLGTTRDYTQGFTIHRTGQALELAPVAMLAGLRGYKAVLDGVALVRTDLDLDRYRASINDLEQLWPDYFAALTAIDNSLWPTGRTASPIAVFAYTQTGKTRWWLHVPAIGLLIEAAEPKTKPNWLDQRLHEAQRYTAEHRPDLFTPTQRWVTIAVEAASVVPLPNARAIPDTSYLEHRDDWTLQPLDITQKLNEPSAGIDGAHAEPD